MTGQPPEETNQQPPVNPSEEKPPQGNPSEEETPTKKEETTQPVTSQPNVSDEPNPNRQKPSDRRRGSDLTIGKIIAAILLLAGVTALIVWLIYRPHKPRFSVIAAAIYKLDATSSPPPSIIASMQFTLITRNPNRRADIIYDQLSAYVSYRNQKITLPIDLPQLYHKTKSTVTLSPILGGREQVPVSSDVVNGLWKDKSYGVVSLRMVLLGKLRWKGGAIKTGRHGVEVKCDISVGLKKGHVGQVPLLGSPPCKVDI